MKKWEKQLVKDFKAGRRTRQLAFDYCNKLEGIYPCDLREDVEAIIRRWMNR